MYDQVMTKTNYKIENIKNSTWKNILKDGNKIGMCVDEVAGCQLVWREENSPHDLFYVASADGCVNSVDRSIL